jgi:hypothetical protein
MERYHAMYPQVQFGANLLNDAVNKSFGIKTPHLGSNIGQPFTEFGVYRTLGFKRTTDFNALDMRRAHKMRSRLTDVYDFKPNIKGDVLHLHKEVVTDKGTLIADVAMNKGTKPSITVTVALREAGNLPKRDTKIHPYTQQELSQAFDLVKPEHGWKKPILSEIDSALQDVVTAAIIHFTASKPEFKKAAKPGRLKVRAAGYTASL